METVRFVASEATQELFEKGYKIFPLLDEEAIARLTELFYSHHQETPEGMYATIHSEDLEFRKEMSDKAMAIIEPFVEGKFENIKLTGGTFMTKAPGEKGVLPLHQDWNLVDEEKERSYNLWIPLVDVYRENGAMRILPKSHMKQKTYRGFRVPPVLYPISDYVDQFMETVEMKAGEGLLYDHALWHSSPQNQTNELRLALVVGALREDAEIRYYQCVGDTIKEYKSDPSFFFENEWGASPENLPFIREFTHANKLLSKEEFERIYLGKEEKSSERKGFFSRLLSRS